MSNYILVTETHLDHNIIQAFSISLVESLTTLPYSKVIELYTENSEQALKQAQTKYTLLEQQGRVIVPKDTSTETIHSMIPTLYIRYTKTTFLMLGMLSDYDLRAQEALLKLLEEPPANLCIICTVLQKKDVLPTILSRSKILHIPTQLLLRMLDTTFFEEIRKQLPDYKDMVKAMLKNQELSIDTKKLTLVERKHIQGYLWQIEYYCNQILQHDPKQVVAISKILYSALRARLLNEASVQKKLVFASLF